MKKTVLSIIFLLMLICVPSMVLATGENVAQIGDTEYAKLSEAVSKAGADNETKITLLKNAELDEVLDITGNVVIDLNGFSITANKSLKSTTGLLMVHSGGTLTVNDAKGTGKIIGGKGTYGAIQVTKKETYDVNKKAKVVINNGTLEGYYYGIMGNGSRHNTEIIINGGNINGGKDDGTGIYNPQNGKLTVNGGTITGASGIEIRAGELTVMGGTIIGLAAPSKVTPNGSGTTSVGIGVAISQNKEKLPINVVITGGTIKGHSALYESNPQNNEAEAIAKISVKVNGGKFETINGGKVAVYSEDNTGFISGGTFNAEVNAKYLAKNVTSEKDSSGNYVVGTRYSVVVKETTNGTVKVSSERAMEGETVKLTVTPDKGYRLSELTVNGENIVDNKFEMPSKDAEVVAKFEIIPTDVDFVVPENKTEENNVGSVENEDVKEILDSSLKADQDLNKKVEEARKEGKDVKVTVNIEKIDEKDIKDEDKEKLLAVVSEDGTVHQYLDISVLVSVDNEELGKITNLTDKMKFSIKLSEDLVKEGRKFYILKLHDGKVEKIEAVVNGTNLEFETDEFSTFALAYEDNAEDVAVDGKDDTPKTGTIYVSTFIWLSIATIALVAIVKTKKVSKHSK